MKNIKTKEDLKHRNAKDALESIREWTGWCFSATPRSTSQPTTQIFRQLFLQLHSASCN